MASITRAEKLAAIREGGWTDRMHTVHKLRRYSCGEHQWGVASLCQFLWPDCSKNLLLACLEHDIPERWCGDSPHPLKKRFEPEIGKLLHKAETRFANLLGLYPVDDLSAENKKRLAFCDMLELVLWAREEIQMGNTLMEGTYQNGLTVLESMEGWKAHGALLEEFFEVPVSESTDWWKEMSKCSSD